MVDFLWEIFAKIPFFFPGQPLSDGLGASKIQSSTNKDSTITSRVESNRHGLNPKYIPVYFPGQILSLGTAKILLQRSCHVLALFLVL